MTPLSSKEKAALRGVAQRLKPAVHIGRKGLQEGTVRELQQAFSNEELVKVAFRAERDEMGALVREVEEALDCECVGGVGKRRSFYRPLADA